MNTGETYSTLERILTLSGMHKPRGAFSFREAFVESNHTTEASTGFRRQYALSAARIKDLILVFNI